MRLYEEVLSDADDHGLMVIFHGCTLPRGWERMYPNYVGSEAVLASDPALPNILAACEALWGKSGVAGLAAATVSGSFYPLLKRGLGHGNACEPVLAWLAGEATEETMREMVDG